MKYYIIKTSSGDIGGFNSDEIKDVLVQMAKGIKIIITERGVFNASFFVCIIEDKKMMELKSDCEYYENGQLTGKKYNRPIGILKEVREQLLQNMNMFPDYKLRNQVDEEVALLDRLDK